MPDVAPTYREPEALVFLSTLYGQSAPGFLTLWRRQDRTTLWLPANEVARASRVAVASAGTMDTYVGMGLRRAAGGTHERGKLDDVIGIPSVWDDIDIQGPAHKKERLPATREEALAFLAELPLAPSLIVDSGWGIQPHWLLDRPWIFADATERREAAALVQRFQAAIHQQSTAYGWTLDSTHDLTRVLRIPGTINHKLAPVPVFLSGCSSGIPICGTAGPTSSDCRRRSRRKCRPISQRLRCRFRRRSPSWTSTPWRFRMRHGS
jgi:hypothetical protein